MTPLAVRWIATPHYLEAVEDEPRADWLRTALVAGAAAVLAAAATYGLTSLQRRDAAPAPAPAAAPGVQVVVTDPPPAPPVPRSERLQVLPSSPPTGAPAPSQTFAPSPAQNVVAPPAERALRPAPAPRNPFDRCADAPTAARRMVCSDMRVAAADQKMKKAYAAALAAGVPHRRLARDQDRWLQAREDAARVSRRAVLDAYRERTRELNAMGKRH